MLKGEYENLFHDLVRLRRAERNSPGNPDIGSVRLHLEEILGGVAKPAFAARVLGVSRPALRRWIEKKDVPTVIGPDGRSAIPLPLLVELSEAVEKGRAAGRKHVLEAAISEGRDRADRLPRNLAEPRGENSLEGADLRSLAYHRAVARRLDRQTVDVALALLRHWRRTGSIDPRYADAWERILEGPVRDIKKFLEDEGDEARDLRQNSPFPGLLSEPERRAVLSRVQ